MSNALPVKIDTLLEPLLTGVIRFKLRLSSSRETQHEEAEDIYQEVVLQLLAQLQRFRRLPSGNPITDLRGMAAIIAHRTCARWMRRQFPERHAFKNRLHYLLTRQRGLALWQDGDGKLLAGFAVWQQQNLRPTTHSLSDIEKLPTHIRAFKSDKPQQLAELIASLFNYLGGPIEFDELVSGVAALQGINDQPIESLAGDENTSFEPAASARDPAWRVEKKFFLQRLWEELQQLPKNQRAALLLNLKDASGFGAITLFPAIGIATVRQLAGALEIVPEELAEMWNELAIEDSRIAELTGLTRQQVINARKSGRERLARRLKGFI